MDNNVRKLDISEFEKEEKRNELGQLIYQKLISKDDKLCFEYIVDFENGLLSKETYKCNQELLSYEVRDCMRIIGNYKPREIIYHYENGLKSCYRMENGEKTLEAVFNKQDKITHRWQKQYFIVPSDESKKTFVWHQEAYTVEEEWNEYANDLLLCKVEHSYVNYPNGERGKNRVKTTTFEYEIENHKCHEKLIGANSKGVIKHRDITYNCDDNGNCVDNELETDDYED